MYKGEFVSPSSSLPTTLVVGSVRRPVDDGLAEPGVNDLLADANSYRMGGDCVGGKDDTTAE